MRSPNPQSGRRSIEKLEKAGITTVDQYLSLGDTGSEVRTAIATQIKLGLLRPVSDFVSYGYPTV